MRTLIPPSCLLWSLFHYRHHTSPIWRSQSSLYYGPTKLLLHCVVAVHVDYVTISFIKNLSTIRRCLEEFSMMFAVTLTTRERAAATARTILDLQVHHGMRHSQVIIQQTSIKLFLLQCFGLSSWVDISLASHRSSTLLPQGVSRLE